MTSMGRHYGTGLCGSCNGCRILLEPDGDDGGDEYNLIIKRRKSINVTHTSRTSQTYLQQYFCFKFESGPMSELFEL